VGDARLTYEVTGGGKTIVLVHGWANTLHVWDDLVGPLSKNYRVLRYDRRGFGKSTGFADISADPDDLRILLDSLGITSAFVVGLSAGSDVATRFAFAFPRRTNALVRISGPAPDGLLGNRPAEPNAVPRQIARDYGMDSLGKYIFAQLVFAPPSQTAAEAARRKAKFDRDWAEYSGQDLLDPHPQSGRVPAVKWADVDHWTVPTLLMNGDHDLPRQLAVAESLSRHIRGARKVMVANAGHAAHMDQAEIVAKSLMEFFGAIPLAGESGVR
jgi:pimeloyl-ACP methyl ester carboxylesterase